MKVNNSEIRLGPLKYGNTYKFSYVITNTYNSEVELKLIMGCKSCTSATIKKNPLPKGEETQIEVQFTPGSTGEQLKTITVVIMTGTVRRPDLVLKFKGMVNE